MNEQPQKRLKVKEVVAFLQERGFDLTERAVRDEIDKKRLRSIKIRNVHYVAVTDLEVYIRERENMPASEGDLALAV